MSILFPYTLTGSYGALQWPKVDAFPIPQGAVPNQYLSSSDWNVGMSALIELALGITSGSLFGFQRQTVSPVVLAGGSNTDFIYVDSSGSLKFHAKNGSEVALSYNVSNYASLTDAVAAIGSTKQILLLDSATSITAPTTVPLNIELRGTPAGKINLSGSNLTLTGPFVAGLYTVFSGSGQVFFSSIATTALYPQWWGAAAGSPSTDNTVPINAAISASKTSGIAVKVPAGTYNISGTLNWNLHVGTRFEGSGMRQTIFKWTGLSGTMLDIQGSRECYWGEFYVLGNGSGTTGIRCNGLSPNPTTKNTFQRIFVDTHNYGLRIGEVAYQCDQTKYDQVTVYNSSVAAVSIEDANAVLHNFYECYFNSGTLGVTSALTGTGGSFNLWGCGFTLNTDFDISCYPGSRGYSIDGCWTEQGTRFLHTKPGSTSLSVTLTECSINGCSASPAILLESTGHLNIIGGEYKLGPSGSAPQIQIGANNNRRVSVNIEGGEWAGFPFIQTGILNSSIHMRNITYVVTGSTHVMDLANPGTTDGFLSRGSPTAPLSMSLVNSMNFVPSAWCKVPSGTALAAGSNTFSINSLNCTGSADVWVDRVYNYGGLGMPPTIIGRDNGNGSLSLTFGLTGSFVLSSDLVFRINVNPIPYSIA